MNQIDDLMEEIQQRIEKEERVLVTTLTKRMAEELTEYLLRNDIRCNYIHSDVDTLERVKIMDELRQGVYDVLVGVNLLREGLDLPEVSLVAISGCRQRRVPPLPPFADPDSRTRRPQYQWKSNHVCRPHDGQHAKDHRRNQPPPRKTAGIQ